MHVSLETESFWVATLILMLLTTLPVKLAADYVEAGRRSMPAAAIAVVVATISAITLYTLFGQSLLGFMLACLGVVLSYKYVLDTPFFSAVSLAIVALGLQFIALSALVGLGMNFQ